MNLNLNHFKKDQSFTTLVDLGMKGFFPLFHRNWLDDVDVTKQTPLSKREKVRAKELISRLLKHRSLERKKIVLLSMQPKDRRIFIKAFLDLVEGKLLDRRPELH